MKLHRLKPISIRYPPKFQCQHLPSQGVMLVRFVVDGKIGGLVCEKCFWLFYKKSKS